MQWALQELKTVNQSSASPLSVPSNHTTVTTVLVAADNSKLNKSMHALQQSIQVNANHVSVAKESLRAVNQSLTEQWHHESFTLRTSFSDQLGALSTAIAGETVSRHNGMDTITRYLKDNMTAIANVVRQHNRSTRSLIQQLDTKAHNSAVERSQTTAAIESIVATGNQLAMDTRGNFTLMEEEFQTMLEVSVQNHTFIQSSLASLRFTSSVSSSNHSIARSMLNGQENRIAVLERVVPTFATQETLNTLRTQSILNSSNHASHLQTLSTYDREVSAFLRPRVVVSLTLLAQHTCVEGCHCQYRVVGAMPNDHVHWTNTTASVGTGTCNLYYTNTCLYSLGC
jgi:hypothetical protein